MQNHNGLPVAGDTLVASINGRMVSGTVRYAGARIITLDQGSGNTLIFRHDVAADRWMQGRVEAQFVVVQPVPSFAVRLEEIARLARERVSVRI
jgi:hypothetical protein